MHRMVFIVIAAGLSIATLFTVALAKERTLPYDPPGNEYEEYEVYLPLAIGGARTDSTPISITVPLVRFYEATSTGTITEAIGLEHEVSFSGNLPSQRAYAFVEVMCPLGDCAIRIEPHVKRLVLVFDTSGVSWNSTVVISAEVRFGVASYFPPYQQPDVPLLVSQAAVATPQDAQTAFTGGDHGEEWEWWLEHVRIGNLPTCNQRLRVPVNKVDFSNPETALFVRSSVEERPELWPGDALSAVFVHHLGWGDVCPYPRTPLLILWVREKAE